MKTIMALALAVVLTVTAGGSLFSATAYAQRASRQVDVKVSVTIVLIRDYIGPDDFDQVPRTYRYPSTQTLARGQEEIRSNASIRAALQRRGIAFRNVVGVQTAFSGGKIVYIR